MFIVAAAYVFDVRMLMEQHAVLRADAEKAAFKIRAAQREKQRASLHAKQPEQALISDHFSQFSRLVQRYHLEILSASGIQNDDGSLMQAEEYQVALSGDYADLYQFLAVCASAEIKNVVLFSERQQRVRADIRMRMSGEVAARDVPVSHVINPFCGAEKPHAAKKFSREEMQFLGTVVRDDQRYKIEISPDGVVSETGEG